MQVACKSPARLMHVPFNLLVVSTVSSKNFKVKQVVSAATPILRLLQLLFPNDIHEKI